MTEPKSLKQSYESTILGRLKLKLYKEMGFVSESLPSPREQRLFMIDAYAKNYVLGQIFFNILQLSRVTPIDCSTLEEPTNDGLRELIIALEINPLDSTTFVELQNCPPNAPSFLGVLIQRDLLDPSGYTYRVTLLDDSVFPQYIAGRIEIRACRESPEPVFGVLEEGNFIPYSFHDCRNSGILRLVMKTIYHLDKRRQQPISLEQAEKLIDEDPLNPPTDATLLFLLQAAYRGAIPCFRSTVPLTLIRPFDVDFCLDYPLNLISALASEIRSDASAATPLLLYWRNGKFIMSDDYGIYLAHRKLNSSETSAVILGKFPEELGLSSEIGGPELIPPPRFFKGNLSEPEGHPPTSRTLANLYAIYMVLAELIQTPHTKERRLHEFLEQHPVAIGPSGSAVMSEVRLGDEYVIDLAIQIPDVKARTLLIELEKANEPLFTKKGRPRAPVTHAIQQVEDWLRWWRENPNRVPAGLDPTIQPEGMVVIGKSSQLTDADKRRLAHLNTNRLVKIFTYDELLRQLGYLIRNLEDPENTED